MVAAPGLIAEDVVAAGAVGFKVAMKAISPAITHRAAVGLVAPDIATREAAAETFQAFQDRAARPGLMCCWMASGFSTCSKAPVTTFRDKEFGVIVGCGMGGGVTEIIDDVVFFRAPIDRDGAHDLLQRLRTMRRLPSLLTGSQARLAADFIASFSALAASVPWSGFTLEVNPPEAGQGYCGCGRWPVGR
jgi:hypothetical protein